MNYETIEKLNDYDIKSIDLTLNLPVTHIASLADLIYNVCFEMTAADKKEDFFRKQEAIIACANGIILHCNKLFLLCDKLEESDF